MVRWLALGFVTAACGSTPKPAHEVKAPSTCDRVADHEIGLMTASQKAAPEQLDPFRKVITTRCTTDGWSAEMTSCLLKTTTLAEGDACGKYLTPQQASAFQADGQAALENLDAGSAK
ncbi:MAG TPA: hypothetical protein VLT45_06180 [Kofleriaceae bacterium]|nr:hypothetical protein [Kofleriaceae bacterium]